MCHWETTHSLCRLHGLVYCNWSVGIYHLKGQHTSWPDNIPYSANWNLAWLFSRYWFKLYLIVLCSYLFCYVCYFQVLLMSRCPLVFVILTQAASLSHIDVLTTTVKVLSLASSWNTEQHLLSRGFLSTNAPSLVPVSELDNFIQASCTSSEFLQWMHMVLASTADLPHQ